MASSNLLSSQVSTSKKKKLKNPRAWSIIAHQEEEPVTNIMFTVLAYRRVSRFIMDAREPIQRLLVVVLKLWDYDDTHMYKMKTKKKIVTGPGFEYVDAFSNSDDNFSPKRLKQGKGSYPLSWFGLNVGDGINLEYDFGSPTSSLVLVTKIEESGELIAESNEFGNSCGKYPVRARILKQSVMKMPPQYPCSDDEAEPEDQVGEDGRITMLREGLIEKEELTLLLKLGEEEEAERKRNRNRSFFDMYEDMFGSDDDEDSNSDDDDEDEDYESYDDDDEDNDDDDAEASSDDQDI